MMGAGAYRGMRRDLIVVDTQRLLDLKEDEILVSPMNSGATNPFPHPRSLDLFKSCNCPGSRCPSGWIGRTGRFCRFDGLNA